MFNTPLRLPKSVLTKRLTVKIIIYASMLVVLSLAVTAFLTWLNAKRDLEERIKEIEKSYIDIIETALWENDSGNINIILMGLSQLPGIQSVHIHEENGIRFKAGRKEPNEALSRNYPIVHTYNGRVYNLGVLHLEEDTHYVSNKVFRELFYLALSQIAIVLLISVLIFVLVYRSAIGRLLVIQSHTAKISYESLGEPMPTIQENSKPDELDDLRNVINQMQKDLYTSFSVKKSLEEKLRQEQAELEKTVEKRTASLRTANEKLLLEMKEKELLHAERKRIIVDLQNAFDEIKKLSGMLPICANCKKIRNDEGYWDHLESYISQHSEAVFSHSICPDCAKKLYPDIDLYEE